MILNECLTLVCLSVFIAMEAQFLPLPISRWQEILKLINGQQTWLTADQFLNYSLIQASGREAH